MHVFGQLHCKWMHLFERQGTLDVNDYIWQLTGGKIDGGSAEAVLTKMCQHFLRIKFGAQIPEKTGHLKGCQGWERTQGYDLTLRQ